MLAIRKSLLQLIFSGAYLSRWNDKLRPANLWEIDKQGHKMIVAFMLWHERARTLTPDAAHALAQELIEGGIFEYLYRCIITDLKPPIFYRIKANAGHYAELTEFVLGQLEPVVKPLGEDFWERLCVWHTKKQINERTGAQAEPQYSKTGTGLAQREERTGDDAVRILDAAHGYASRWEFELLKDLNRPFDDEIDSIAASFDALMARHSHLPGMDAILQKSSALGRFANLCGQLRFQIRWTQAPRIPATSVLGHTFLVAVFAYFASLTIGACRARRNNNFFCGLLHDMPELLTRDIISPVKHAVKTLTALIRTYEEEELERRIFGPLRAAGYEALAGRMGYYLGLDIGSEFDECVRVDGKALNIDSFETLHTLYNTDDYDPKDGRLLKDCDLLAAFIEAHSSIRNGVASPHLLEAVVRMRRDIAKHSVRALRLETLLADFD